MTKRDFVQQELEKAQRRQSASEQIDGLYRKYLSDGDPYALEDLLTAASRFCRGTVYNALSNNAHFRPADVDDALQEGALAVAASIQKDRAEGVCREGIAGRIKLTYRNKAVDFVRSQYREFGKAYVDSWEKLTTDEDGKTREFLGQDDFQTTEENELLLDCQKLQRRLLLMYCDALMHYKRDPQKPLGVCYARVLYQVESLFEEDRRTATASNIGWAWDRMENKTLVQLGMESQQSLRRHLHPGLKWRKPFLDALRRESPYGGMWKDLVYTDTFTRGQTSNWVESIHASVFTAVRKQIQADTELLGTVRTLDNPFKNTLNQVEVSK